MRFSSGPDDAGDVGVEAVEFAILSAEDGVAGADLGGEGVGLLEVGHDLLLERHGDAETPWMGISWTSLRRSLSLLAWSAR